MDPPRREVSTATPSPSTSTMKRAYKLQEFVAHASNVNCLKIGKKTSRVLVTGGEDHKVNMWAIGRPNAIMSLSGHSSAVECVTFDTAEALVAAGAASGTIKLWDLEEAKIVRTLTGHRSNCISVDFHPFGEFFASGSLDTNLKIWDIRRKGCIHTYKGHTRGVNAIKFSPDGRWVVSGGEDNIVKLWDLTAGKLMHDFKYHEGQILCLDFHPHEFLLATAISMQETVKILVNYRYFAPDAILHAGRFPLKNVYYTPYFIVSDLSGSADRTVKFWDLETFELIGSAGPETSGVRSMVFNPDGRTLLAGLHENMKVFSWEPLRCHDIVDVGWSKLGDLNIHEGKLLGCSYNQSCVGIWVVDLSCVGPYAPGRMNGTSMINQPTQQMVDGSLKSSSVVRNVSPQPSMKDLKLSPTLSAESAPSRVTRTSSTKVSTVGSSTTAAYALASKRSGAVKGQASPVVQPMSKIDAAPVIVPRHTPGAEPVVVRPVEISSTGPLLHLISAQINDSGRGNNSKNIGDGNQSAEIGSLGRKSPTHRGRMHPGANLLCSETQNDGVSIVGENEPGKWIGPGKFRRTDSFGSQRDDDGTKSENRYSSPRVATLAGAIESGRRSVASGYDKKEMVDMIYMPAGHGKGTQGIMDGSSIMIGNDSDIVEQLMQPHSSFVITMQSRFMKLQIIRRFWTKNDLKGAVEAMAKMADHSVLVDVLSCLVERSEVFTLEACMLLLPLLNGLLSSNLDRYLSTALAVISLLVKNFGQIIHSTRTASPSFGVDIHAEERIERCNVCYVELQSIMQSLTPLLRRTGDIGRSAQDLSITLQEV